MFFCERKYVFCCRKTIIYERKCIFLHGKTIIKERKTIKNEPFGFFTR